MCRPLETPVALRCWPVPAEGKKRAQSRANGRSSWIGQRVLLLATGALCEARPNLNVGAFSVIVEGTQIACGLIVANSLRAADPDCFAAVRSYAQAAGMVVVSRSEFVERVLYREAFRLGALVVGFGLPKQLGRLASRRTTCRGRNRDSFSFSMSDRPWVPDICVKPLTAHAATIRFLRPDSHAAPGRSIKPFDGRFLDLHAICYALTGERHTMESAASSLGVTVGPQALTDRAAVDGVTTEGGHPQARHELARVFSLYVAVRDAYSAFPFATAAPERLQATTDTPITRLYTPASIAKAYFRHMGIAGAAGALQGVDPQYLGYAMAAFYGGRSECRIRRTPVPATVLDFSSQYPAVFTLLNLWPQVIASRIAVSEVPAEQLQDLLREITRDPAKLLDRAVWPLLAAYAQVLPNGDVLPVRAPFSAGEDGSQDNVNVSVAPLSSSEPMWFAVPDLAASAIQTGRAPNVLQAFVSHAVESVPGLRPLHLGYAVLDPYDPALFVGVVAERRRLRQDGRASMAAGAKALANSGCYGVFAEVNTKLLARKEKRFPLRLYAEGVQSYNAVGQYEAPGSFANPLVSSLVTSGGRLLLSMLQREVERRGGSFAWTATDAMAVVTDNGPRAPSPPAAVRPLSAAEVADIRQAFAAVSPFDPAAVPSFLKEEVRGTAYAVSANRYCVVSGSGEPLKWSLSGLGGIAPPGGLSLTEFGMQLWKSVLRDEFPQHWDRQPLLRQLPLRTVKSWVAVRPAHGKVEAEPFGMAYALSVYHTLGFRRPSAAPGYLVGAGGTDAGAALKRHWVNPTTGERVHVALPPLSPGMAPPPGTHHIETVGAFARDHGYLPEPTMMDANGSECATYTIGVLQPRPIVRRGACLVGKESDRLRIESETDADLDAERPTVHGPALTGADSGATPRRRLPTAALSEALLLLKQYPAAEVARGLDVSPQQWRKLRAELHTPSGETWDRIVLIANALPNAPPQLPTERAECVRRAVAGLTHRALPRQTQDASVSA